MAELRIKEICRGLGITIGELADAMDIKRESLSRAINGKPNMETLEKISKALGVHISDLFKRPNDSGFVCPNCGERFKVVKD